MKHNEFYILEIGTSTFTYTGNLSVPIKILVVLNVYAYLYLEIPSAICRLSKRINCHGNQKYMY